MEAQRCVPGEEQRASLPGGQVTVKEENLDQMYLDDGECKLVAGFSTSIELMLLNDAWWCNIHVF
jgi:hypothetical protein